MDKEFLERLGSSTFIYVNFEKTISESFNYPPYQNHNCRIHYTNTDTRDLRLAGELANPRQENFLTISYQTKNQDYLIQSQVNPKIIKELAKNHGVKVKVTFTQRNLKVQTRIAVNNNKPEKVVPFLVALSQLAFECLV